MKVPSRCAQRGFGIIEIFVVAAIIGIVASLTIPELRGSMTAYRLTASANIVAEELDAARVMAISRGAIYEVRFSSREVAVIDVEDNGAAARLPKNFEPGVTIAAAPMSGIRFFPRGFAQAGQVVIRNENGSIKVEVLASGKIQVTRMTE